MKLKFLLFLPIVFFLISPKLIRAASPSLKFNSNSKDISLGEEFTVDVIVDTAGEQAVGADAIVLFDGNVLEAESINPGTIFSDYPSLIIDNKKGKLTISGIVKAQSSLFSGSGVLASINFKSIAVGNANLHFDFTQGSTRDSNIAVTKGNGDVLTEVGSMSVKSVQTGAVVPQKEAAAKNQNIFQKINSFASSILQQIIEFANTHIVKKKVDPYADMGYLEPKTEPVDVQPLTKDSYKTTLFSPGVSYFLLSVAVIAVVAIVWVGFYLLGKASNRKPTIVQKLE